MGRAPCCEKVGLKRGRWTSEEDEILTNYIQANGEGSWRSLPKNAGLLRCGKSCRLRWINYLRSDLKRGNITPQEEDVIIKLHASLGNRWSLIAGHLPGRTDNEIKNYWNSHLSRTIHSFRRLSNEALAAPVVVNLAKANIAAKRRGGRTSRSAMKKNKTYKLSSTTAPPKSSSENPKDQSQVVATLPIMPTTPTLEKEPTSSWHNNHEVTNVVVGPCATTEEGRNNLVVSSPFQDSHGGIMSGSSDDQRITECPCIAHHNHDQDRENNVLMLGIYEGLDSPVLCFNDIIGDDLRTSEEDTNNNSNNNNNNTADQKENGVTTNSNEMTISGDWYSCNTISTTNSSVDDMTKMVDWDWDWDWDFNDNWDNLGVFQGDCEDHMLKEDEESTMMTRLWEDDGVVEECNKLGENEKQHKALVAWLFS